MADYILIALQARQVLGGRRAGMMGKQERSHAVIRLNALILFLSPAVMVSAQTSTQTQCPQQTLVGINGLPMEAQNYYQQYLDTLNTVRCQITTPASPMPATINLSPDIQPYYMCGWCSIPGTIFAGSTTVFDGPTGGNGLGFLHELMHQSLPPGMLGMDPGLDEALAGAKEESILVLLYQQNPSLFPPGTYIPTATCGPAMHMWNDLPMTVYGGAMYANGTNNFWGNAENTGTSACSIIAHLINEMGGDYRMLDAAINKNVPMTRAAFNAMLDSLGFTIDGVRPSTYMNADVTNFVASDIPSGPYFGANSVGGWDSYYQSLGASSAWPFNPFGIGPFLVQQVTQPDGSITPIILNLASAPNPVPIAWWIYDADGNVMTSRTEDARGDTITLAVLNSDGSWGDWFYQTFPTGGYRIHICQTATLGSNVCSGAPNSDVTLFFAILNGEELSPCDVVFKANGPQWNQLTADFTLDLVSPSEATLEQHLGMAIVRNVPRRSDGTCQAVTVKHGDYIRTSSTEKLSPHDVDFTAYQQPILYALSRATDGNIPPRVVSGEILSFYGNHMTLNEPCAASGFPLSSSGCPTTATNYQGPDEIRFTMQDGRTYDASFLYDSATQINAVVPWELSTNYAGQTAQCAEFQNGVQSNQALTVTIGSSDPSPFLTNFTTQEVAATFAVGSKVGTTVSTSNPAAAGDVITIYATGLGSVVDSNNNVNPIADGMPAPTTELLASQAAVSVTIGGMPAQVLWAGLTPGFDGLYQINLIVPSVPQGPQAVTITEVGAIANSTSFGGTSPVLAVQ